MSRNSTPRATIRKPAASKQSQTRGDELTRAVSGDILDSSPRSSAMDGSEPAARTNEQGATSAAATSSAPSSRSTQTSAAKGTTGSSPELSLHQRIELAAYYRAEARGFAPGQDREDWIAAERELSEQAGQGVIG